MRSGLLALGALLITAADPAAAEIYRWVDEKGTVHFTQNLSEVPLDQRQDAAGPSPDSAPAVQTYAPPARAVPEPRAKPSGGSAEDRVYRIRVQRAGNSMQVKVRLNGQVVAPFVIDTGATDVTIPKWVADRLGIEVGPDTRRQRYVTANGVVEEPVVMLDSVELGGARVQDIPASINDSMPIGLLGLSFFNHFSYHVDAAAGIVTLKPNDLGETGALRGGRSEIQWRTAFRALRGQIEAIDRHLNSLDPLRARHAKTYVEQRARLERELELLDEEANRARVPDAWRF